MIGTTSGPPTVTPRRERMAAMGQGALPIDDLRNASAARARPRLSRTWPAQAISTQLAVNVPNEDYITQPA